MVKLKILALDSNTVIAYLNGDTKASSFINGYDLIYLPSIVCGELQFGALNSSRKDENIIKLRSFIDNCMVLSVNKIVAEIYAEIRLSLKQNGTPIPENDIWIAAICIANNLPLFTLDKHFSHIKELNLISI